MNGAHSVVSHRSFVRVPFLQQKCLSDHEIGREVTVISADRRARHYTCSLARERPKCSSSSHLSLLESPSTPSVSVVEFTRASLPHSLASSSSLKMSAVSRNGLCYVSSDSERGEAEGWAQVRPPRREEGGRKCNMFVFPLSTPPKSSRLHATFPSRARPHNDDERNGDHFLLLSRPLSPLCTFRRRIYNCSFVRSFVRPFVRSALLQLGVFRRSCFGRRRRRRRIKLRKNNVGQRP